jgi:hypothetical protein
LGGSILGKTLARAQAGSDEIRTAVGRQQTEWMKWRDVQAPRQAEFRVFSQWGEDGIIQYLVNKVPIADESFVEIGVEDYREANTRFLLVNNDWRGLIIDSGHAHVDFLNWTSLRWRHSIEPLSLFVTRDNINATLADAGFHGDIGLLSVDVDGNDYWLFDAVTVARPRILVIEYNSLFGAKAAVCVPYDPTFTQRSAHHSRLYFGASLGALDHLATRKGYSLVAGNRAGCNAFFVRNDVLGDLCPMSVADAYVTSRFRSSRGRRGELTYVDRHSDRMALIRHLPVLDVTTGRTAPLGHALGL